MTVLEPSLDAAAAINMPRLSLAPAHNALNTLALLNRAGQMAMRSPGVRQMVLSLSAQQRQHNRLLFDALGDALMPDEEWSSFPAYVESLAAREPLSFRDQLLRRLALPYGNTPAGTPEQLRRNLQTFVTHVSRRSESPLEPALLQEAHMLLNEPQRLQALVVSHLRALWQSVLASEWEHLTPVLQTLLPGCAQRIAQHTTAADRLHALIEADVPASVSAQLRGTPIVFVLSGHMQHSARAVRTEHTLWLFFGLPPHPAIWRRSPVGKAELLVRLRALADETSLQLLAQLTQQTELSAQDMIARLQLSQPNASRHLKQLVTAGFIQVRRHGGATKMYRLTPAHIVQTLHALEQHLAEPTPIGSPPRVESTTNAPAELRGLIDAQARVVRWPTKRKEQHMILDYLASQFERDKQYSEKEVNALLQQWHLWNDPALLRRELVDGHWLDRTKNGARYWRVKANGES